jgi:hypothetical protein
VRPETEAYKKLSFIGPRRFFVSKDFITLKEITMKTSELNHLKCGKYTPDNECDVLAQLTDKIVIANLSPLLPVFPFGFSTDIYENNYAYVKFNSTVGE